MKKSFFLALFVVLVSCKEPEPEFGIFIEPVYLYQLIDKASGQDFFDAHDSVYHIQEYDIVKPSTFRAALWKYDTLNVLILRDPELYFSDYFEVKLAYDVYRFDIKSKGSWYEPEIFTLIYNDRADSTVMDFKKDPMLLEKLQTRNTFVYGENPQEPPFVFPIYLEKK
ncbi:hypothetical protein [Marinoscillum sp. MHG1-6]|uniref:hypothetical protein n=1 Tax=Marinoscillum sp. MHG1-6 TaxID=2959627 RepID=UPI00215882A2|nr:hypothetical protein [Marinoscillum sp. MHG1-6]